MSDKWKIYGVSIGLAQAVGLVSGLLIKDGIKAFENMPKPALTPPEIVFPIVWVILYLLMGIGAARIWENKGNGKRKYALTLYVIQLVFNFFWGIIFFNLQQYGFAYFWILILLVLIANMLLEFKNIDMWAAIINIPYLLWVLFATYLNYGTWMLNM